MKDKLLQIISYYKINNQQRKFVEECYELIEAIINYQSSGFNYDKEARDIEKENTHHIAEEISDCLVMLKQFQYYYDIEDEKIKNIMEYKIQRQLERIEKEKQDV